MSILLADAPPSTQDLSPAVGGGLLIWLILAILCVKPLGVFRRRSIDGPQRIAPSESVWIMAFILFASYFVAASVGGMLIGKAGLLITNAACDAAGAILLVLASVALRPDGLTRLGLQLRRLPTGALTGAVLIFVMFPLVGATSEVTSLFLQWTGRPQPEAHQVLQSIGKTHDWKVIALDVGLAVIVAPVFEELIFRGFLQTILGRFFQWFTPNRTTARWLAVVGVAVLFAAEHRVPAFMPPLIVLAIGLGYTYERTGNLWATITAHAVFNSMQIVLYLSSPAH